MVLFSLGVVVVFLFVCLNKVAVKEFSPNGAFGIVLYSWHVALAIVKHVRNETMFPGDIDVP